MMRKKHFLFILLSVLISFVFSFILLLYPGYLTDHSFLSCIYELKFTSLICGRLVFFIVVILISGILFFMMNAVCSETLLKMSFHNEKENGKKDILFSLFVSVFVSSVYCLYRVPCNTTISISLLVWVILFAIVIFFICFSVCMIIRNSTFHQLNIRLYTPNYTQLWTDYRISFCSSIISGFLAYFWFFSNKIPNHDDVLYLFSKGLELSSGRWGLNIISLFFPDFSMPWLYGILSVVVLGISCCLIIRIFKIDSKFFQILIPAIIICFPAETGTILYMFTALPFAIAFFFIVFSVFLLHSKAKSIVYYVIAVFMAVFSISIYQAYITIAAALLVSLLILDIVFSDQTESEILKESIRFLLFLILSLLFYLLINKMVLSFCGTEFNEYAKKALSSHFSFSRIIDSFQAFSDTLLSGLYGFVRSSPSKICHIVILSSIIFVGWFSLSDNTSISRRIMFLSYTFILLPLSIYGLILLLGNSETYIYTLTQYSFIAVYILAAAIIVRVENINLVKRLCRSIVSIALCIIVASNIIYSNKVGLDQYMEYENACSIYTSIVSQIQQVEGFDENCKIAITGNIPPSNYRDHFNTENGIYGTTILRNLNYERRCLFISYYIGIDLNYATEEEVAAVRRTDEFSTQPSYPYNGYISKIDNIIVVKLSE